MDQFFASLPKMVVAIGAIVIGFFVIIVFNPPVTVCDAQMEIFRESQKKFLYPVVTENITKPSLAKTLEKNCKQDNSPGGCFELLVGLKKFSVDLDNIPRHCADTAASEPQIQEWVWSGMRLITQLAWGDRAPASHVQKNGWLDSSDLVLFCGLRKNAIRIYGNDAYNQWREALLVSLPQADKLTRELAWQKSLLSTPCDSYR